MKYFSLGFQSLLAIAIMAAALYGEIYIVLLLQFLTGAWQFGDALRHLIWVRPDKIIRKYLILATVYLVVYLILVDSKTGISTYLLLLPSWLLAIYYYTITWRKTFVMQKNTSSFLPHVNF